ncbi:MAG: hypothetical protein IJZ55_12470 [Lachnospiraceae bacterium]|nr:hypothetical protein [Lachnospiraceae bacterium]
MGKKRNKNRWLALVAALVIGILTGCNGTVETTEGNGQGIIKDETNASLTATAAPTATPTPEQRELSNHISQCHKDEISAGLVESGYYHELNQTFAEGAFQIELKALVGDTENQVLVFDVRVEEEELTETYDELELSVYFMNERDYDELESKWTYAAYGKQDETDKSLYHVTIQGVLFLTAEEIPTVVDLQSITFGKKTLEPKQYSIDTPEYRFVVSKQKFYPAERRRYESVSLVYKGSECNLYEAYFGQYETMLFFDVTMNPDNITTGIQRKNDIQTKWREFASNVMLEVDGVIYHYEGDAYLSASEGDEECSGNAHLSFPGIDFGSAEKVVLWLDSKGYDLKTGEVFDGVRTEQEPVAGFNEPFTVERGKAVTVGREGITLRLLNVIHEPDNTWIAFELMVDGTLHQGSGVCYADETRLVQHPFTKHVVRYVVSEGDKVTLMLTEDYQVQKPLVLSGNAEDLYVTEKPEYIESENTIMFLDKGVEVPGNLPEQMESILAMIEEETGFEFFNDTGYSTYVSDARHVLWGQDGFLGVDMEQEKFHIYVVPHDVWWPSSSGDMIVVGPEDIRFGMGEGNTVIHEMAHAAAQRNGVQMNRILDEGFATYIEGKVSEEDKLFRFDYDARENYEKVYADAEITAETAETEFVKDVIDDYNYVYGYWFITYLMENYGDDIYHKLLAAANAEADMYQGEMTKEEMVPIVKSVTSETVFEEFGAWFEDMAKDWPRATIHYRE